MEYDYEKLWKELKKNFRRDIKLLESGINPKNTTVLLLTYRAILENMEHMEEYQRVDAELAE